MRKQSYEPVFLHPIDGMSIATSDVYPIPYGFTSADEHLERTGERLYDTFPTGTCERCNARIAHNDIRQGCGDRHGSLVGISECNGEVVGRDTPGFETVYPLAPSYRPEDDETCGPLNIADLPLLLIENLNRDDKSWRFALALVGDGRNFNWAITEAYMRLNQLPPAELLPISADGAPGDLKRRAWLVQGMRETARLNLAVAQRIRTRITELAEEVEPARMKMSL